MITVVEERLHDEGRILGIPMAQMIVVFLPPLQMRLDASLERHSVPTLCGKLWRFWRSIGISVVLN
jgi:hypothetical protein